MKDPLCDSGRVPKSKRRNSLVFILLPIDKQDILQTGLESVSLFLFVFLFSRQVVHLPRR